jgi:hypothetical protein
LVSYIQTDVKNIDEIRKIQKNENIQNFVENQADASNSKISVDESGSESSELLDTTETCITAKSEEIEVESSDKILAEVLKSLENFKNERFHMAEKLESFGFKCFPMFEKHAFGKNSINVSSKQRLQDILLSNVAKTMTIEEFLTKFEPNYLKYKDLTDDFYMRIIKNHKFKVQMMARNVDLGAYMGKNLVCLDADDEESFKLLIAILPANVLIQKTLRGGHVFLHDRAKLLKGINKIGNIDVIQGEKGVKVWDEKGIYQFTHIPEGDIYNMSAEDVTNIDLYLAKFRTGAEVLPKIMKINKKIEKTGNFGNIREMADNVLEVMKGGAIEFSIPEGYRNNTLFGILASLRSRGYTKKVITDACEVISKYFFEGADDYSNTKSTLKSILRGKNKNGYQQFVSMFSVELC